MKRWWKERRRAIFSRVGYALARFIGKTLRVELKGVEEAAQLPTGVIFCGWHGRSFIPGMVFFGRHYWAIISHSKDGEMQTYVFGKLGFQIIRGSTGRGGERALIESIRVLRDKGRMAITPDGPRGPIHVVQPGVIAMAKKSGAALVPVGSQAARGWTLGTWDAYQIPKPFSRARFYAGDPIYVSPDADAEEMEMARVKLEQAIKAVQSATESSF